MLTSEEKRMALRANVRGLAIESTLEDFEGEVLEVAHNRMVRFAELGFDPLTSTFLAVVVKDAHPSEAKRLLDAGCSHSLAVEILQ